MLNEGSTESKGTENNSADEHPVTTPMQVPVSAETRAFLLACCARVAGVRRDLDGPWLAVAAALCGADWLRARDRSRRVLRAVVLQDVGEAKDAWITAQIDDDSPLRHPVSLVRESLATGARMGRRANRRRLRRTLRGVARTEQPCDPPGNRSLANAHGLREALPAAMASCPIIPPRTWAHALWTRWPDFPVFNDTRASQQRLFRRVMDFGATWHGALYSARARRGRRLGSFGNDIIDRAEDAGAGRSITEIRAFFAAVAAPGIGGAR